MRTAKQILEEMPDDDLAERNLQKAQVDILQLVLEVFLDIRDALVVKAAPKPAPPAPKAPVQTPPVQPKAKARVKKK